MKSELDELIAAVDGFEPRIDTGSQERRVITAAQRYVEAAKRAKGCGIATTSASEAAGIVTLLEEITTQLTRDENYYTAYGGDPKTRKGNLTVYLPYELLRKTLRS